MSDNPLAPEAQDEVNAVLPGLVRPHFRPLVVVALEKQLVDEVHCPGGPRHDRQSSAAVQRTCAGNGKISYLHHKEDDACVPSRNVH